MMWSNMFPMGDSHLLGAVSAMNLNE